MTAPADPPRGPDILADALLAARLIAVDPAGLGGMVLRGGDSGVGGARDAVVAALAAALPAGAPVRRLPIGIDDERLLGGIDLGAALAQGTATWRAGLLTEVDGGALIVPMAERLSEGTAARIAVALDQGEVIAERDGMTRAAPARFAVLAFDDGRDRDGAVPSALAERLAFRVDLDLIVSQNFNVSQHTPFVPSAVEGRAPNDGPDNTPLDCARDERSLGGSKFARDQPGFKGSGRARDERSLGGNKFTGKERCLNGTDLPRLDDVMPLPAELLAAIAETAAMLGIDSMRAPLFTLRAARAAAALAGRRTIAEADVALAARLVLGPRATRLPPADMSTAADDSPPPPPPPSADPDAAPSAQPPAGPLQDQIIAAALARLPAGVLAEIASGGRRRGPAGRARGKGERRRSPSRGRPVGARPGVPRGGLRLSLIDTLRAAAPWQRLRGDAPIGAARLRIRRDDLRVHRFESRAEATTIFAVDASGSSALARLAEAKGAVELLLGEAYVKRAQVALIAFRGQGAELLLPPTRSLVRARRSLADLPGGGGTPIAAGIDAARALADQARQGGRTPFVVLLTDGRANVASDGSHGRERADGDALAAARRVAAAGVKAALVDISPRPRPEAAALAAAMDARYLPLPRADAGAMHAAIKAAQSC